MSSPNISNWQYDSPENELCLKGGSEKRSRISVASCCKDFSVLTQIRNDIRMAPSGGWRFTGISIMHKGTRDHNRCSFAIDSRAMMMYSHTSSYASECRGVKRLNRLSRFSMVPVMLLPPNFASATTTCYTSNINLI